MKIAFAILGVITLGVLVPIVVLYATTTPNLFSPDSDGDGIADSRDAFPDDPREWSDLDRDGVGDNADFFDQGNGAIKISVTRFQSDGTCDFLVFTECDPYFVFGIDMDGDGQFEWSKVTKNHENMDALSGLPLSEDYFVVDAPENLQTAKFMIVVFDKDIDFLKLLLDIVGGAVLTDLLGPLGALVPLNTILDALLPSADDVIDYVPVESGNYYEHTISSPFVESWSFDGSDDGKDGEIDALLEYRVDVVGI